MGIAVWFSPGKYSGMVSGDEMSGIGSYLRKHTDALVKDVGIEATCELTGKSKATLGAVLFRCR